MSEWIEWNGGDFPTDDDVVVRLRDGTTDGPVSAIHYEWRHFDTKGDIVGYKLADNLTVEPNSTVDFPDGIIDLDSKQINLGKNPKYNKEIKGVTVDVYDVLKAFDVRCPALQHLVKKALQCGNRGHKTALEDYDDIIASALRARELNDE